MKISLLALLLLCVCAPLASVVMAAPQTQNASPDYKLEDKETMARLTVLRDAFVKQAVTEGFSCPIKPPVILLQATPSYGNYDDDENALKTPAWHQVDPEGRILFRQIAGPGADEEAVRQAFESAAHRWIFIHEMGHWWQACKKANVDRNHYQQEYEANRIAAAYWRQTDPGFLARMSLIFHGVVANMPSPVPEGKDAEKFFNENYGEALARTNAYPWFQARMNVDVDGEKPAPTFAQALRETGK